MRAGIEAIAYHLPASVVSNRDLEAANPNWQMESVEAKAGVIERRIAAPEETAFDLGVHACEKLMAETGLDKRTIDGIIFCTQTPDYIMPSNAHLLHGHLQLADGVLAFDIDLACSGYVYGLALASSLICSGIATRVLLINADTYSKLIHPKDRSCRVLFGDGAAASLIAADESGGGFVDFALATHGSQYDKFFVPAGAMRRPKSKETAIEETDRNGNVRTAENIHMDGLAVWAFINTAVPSQIRAILDRNGLTKDDIDQFIFHQASRMTLDSLMKALKIPTSKAYSNLERLGNTVSASIPIAIRDALDAGVIQPGQRLLLSGFGVGLSYASAILEYR